MRRAQSKRVRDAVSSHLGQRSIDAADLESLALHEVDLAGCEAHGSRRMRRPRTVQVEFAAQLNITLLASY